MTKLDERSSRKLKIRMHGILNSTMVGAIGYDLATKTLRIKFKRTGAVYDYRRVPAEVFCQLMGAGSTGLGMHANILKNYDFVIVSKSEISVEEIVETMKETEDEEVVID